MSSALLSGQQGAVRILRINNPGMRNAITASLYAALPQALRDAQDDPSVGAIVLTGAGGFFCAGGDLTQLALRQAMAPALRREKLEGLHSLIRALRDCSKPVIAAVEGGAAGAGLSLALACDMLVVARDAVFSMAYVKVGLSPDGGATAFMAEFVSRQLLTELCLSGERISAERLHSLGPVNRLTDSGGALSKALALAQRLAQGPQRANARIKTLCRSAHHADLHTQMELEAALMVESQGDAEAAEGIGAFLGKRAPDFAAAQQANVSTATP
jgi:enoyl-CoA hydratase/carnithine racemase